MADNYNVIVQELVRRSNEETRRLRNIEQRLDAMEDKLNVLYENTADRTKKANVRFADVEVALTNLTNEITNLKLNIDKMGKQLPKYAQKKELKEIEHMLSLLGPVREKEIEA